MVFPKTWQVMIVSTALLTAPAWASRSHRSATSHHGHHARRVAAKHEIRGQREIDADRTREIQTALIREHYLTGEPSGQWDADTQAAMQKYQADHGWQTKLMPDSRALIKLGLGPKVDASETQTATSQPKLPQPSIDPADTLAAAHSIQN
jgi:hypothetical protein